MSVAVCAVCAPWRGHGHVRVPSPCVCVCNAPTVFKMTLSVFSTSCLRLLAPKCTTRSTENVGLQTTLRFCGPKNPKWPVAPRIRSKTGSRKCVLPHCSETVLPHCSGSGRPFFGANTPGCGAVCGNFSKRVHFSKNAVYANVFGNFSLLSPTSRPPSSSL